MWCGSSAYRVSARRGLPRPCSTRALANARSIHRLRFTRMWRTSPTRHQRGSPRTSTPGKPGPSWWSIIAHPTCTAISRKLRARSLQGIHPASRCRAGRSRPVGSSGCIFQVAEGRSPGVALGSGQAKTRAARGKRLHKKEYYRSNWRPSDTIMLRSTQALVVYNEGITVYGREVKYLGRRNVGNWPRQCT
jgi:hypothetical protein